MQCLRNKVDTVSLFADEIKCDILCLCEHWLTKEEGPLYNNISDLHLVSAFYRKDLKNGGVAIYTSSRLNINVINLDAYCVELDLELAAVEIVDLSMVVVAVYRSPASDFIKFTELFDVCLDYLLNLKVMKILLVGDYNVHLECTSKEETDFTNLLRSHGLFIASRAPTRKAACLDTAITNINSWEYRVEVTDPIIADHGAVLLKIQTDSVRPQTPTWNSQYLVEKRIVKEENLPLLREELKQIEWDFLSKITDPEACFNAFFSRLKESFDNVFPSRVLKPNKKSMSANKKSYDKDKSWYTSELAKLRSFLVLIHDHYKGASDLLLKEKYYALYLKVKREYSSKVNEAKKCQNMTKIELATNKCKAAWDIVNVHRQSGPRPKMLSSPDEFNDYFSQIADEILSNLPVLQLDPMASVPDLTNTLTLLNWKMVSKKDILSMVKNFKNSLSQDVHGLTCFVLKSVIDQIVDPLTMVVNKCLLSGSFPNILKIARTIPVFKKGDHKLTTNYRPISMLPIISKVIETVMKKQLISFFDTNELFINAQHGFRGGRSTTSALLSLVDFITEAFENKDSALLSLCDLSKAFDIVSHDILLHKLRKYGISGTVLDSVTNFLNNRKQLVSINGASSKLKDMAHGVPQGSVLGPLLFTVMVNDLELNGKTLLFADDTTLLSSGRNLEELRIEADFLLAQAKEWFSANRLKLNEDKTQTLLCTLKPQEKEDSPVKLLGFCVDPKLSWTHHIHQVCVRLSRVLYLLKKLKSEIPKPYLKTVYHALFHSHIMYGLVIWGHSTAVQDVLILQKKAIRIVSHAGRIDHCRPLFKDLGIMTVVSQYVYNALCLLKENIDKFTPREELHCYSTRQNKNLDIPRCRLTLKQRSYPHSALRIYNTLPTGIRGGNLTDFKKWLRDRLVDRPLYSLRELQEEPISVDVRSF